MWVLKKDPPDWRPWCPHAPLCAGSLMRLGGHPPPPYDPGLCLLKASLGDFLHLEKMVEVKASVLLTSYQEAG